ncbi:aldehyde dehydrogenase family protein [Rhodococcus fascians]|nr:aldehyde dehydrogenase family protein [Rhodococcus fascians]MBY3826510.1 aldehyde dehydrogenase family protein [Rhodococcus fascians]MBY3836971.1 aldehyde dehydrogenase family protein [Rhodococcus fascians]MBY3865562.1 aldehyde dehydrogenase family protein [Rhodococcus fascians]MBY3885653.1 aldehyde dehydrogenase family protein [Rhodococcus fascians]
MDITQLAKQYIGGVWRDGAGDKILVDANPYNNETVAEFPVADRADVDEAYKSAAQVQVEWNKVNAYAKRTVFENAARIVGERAQEITQLLAAEVGGTAVKAGFEIGVAIDMLKEAATLPLRIEGSILPSPVADTENFVYREPVGVVGVISPFNFPFFLSLKSVAPALATGNGVVIKPHEETPITGGTLIASIFEEAGLPAGLLNVTVTEIPVIGDYFLEHPIPRVLAFTGSTGVGRHVGEVAARHFKKSILELGGNSAFIVCDDADLDYAVDAAVFSRFTHQGQICMSANRILVHSAIAAEFRDRFSAKVAALPMGDPSDPSTIIGPLINARQLAALDEKIDGAIAAGATAVLRGEAIGNVLPPVILENVTSGSSIAHDELFGPVVVLIEFDTDEEAVAIANDTDFGLSGAVHSGDLSRGVRIAKQIHTGMIHVNDATIADEPIVPFGGEKSSGIGRLNGQASIDELTTQKWISVNHGRRIYPYQQ